VTYKKAQALKAIVKNTPLDRIMLETDAPYLSPEGLRGRRNEPLNIKILAQEIARIKSIDTDKVAEATSTNAREFFRLP
jgi:TatD DNase family protein